MSLIISLEDSSGNDVNLEVLPGDTFHEFTSRASEILGYNVSLSCISGDNLVSSDDNVYEYLLRMAALQEEQEPDSLIHMEDDPQAAELITDIAITDLNVESGAEFHYVEANQADGDGLQEFNPDLNQSTDDNSQETNHVDQSINVALKEDGINHQGLNNLSKKVNKTQNIIDEQKKMEIDLLNIFHKSAGVVKTIKLSDDIEDDSNESLEDEEYLEENEAVEETEEGEVVDENDIHSRITVEQKYTKARLSNSTSLLNSRNMDQFVEAELEDEFPVKDNSDADYTDIEFLDEDILEEDIPKVAVIKEEVKEPDLEDDIDTYTIVKQISNITAGEHDFSQSNKIELAKLNGKQKEKAAFTQQELLNILEDASDSEKSISSKKKNKSNDSMESPSSSYRKQESLNKNDFSKEFEKIAKMGPGAYDSKSFKKLTPKVLKSEPKNNSHKSVESNKEDRLLDEYIRGGYPCRLCNKTFDKLLFAITHTMVHKVQDKPIYPCVLCEYGFSSYPQVRDHMSSNHLKSKKKQSNVESKSENNFHQTKDIKEQDTPRQNKKTKTSHQTKKNYNFQQSKNSVKSSGKLKSTKYDSDKDEPMQLTEDEEWLDDIEILEEWLEDDMEVGEPEDEISVKSEFDESKYWEEFEEEWKPSIPKSKKGGKDIMSSLLYKVPECLKCKKKFKNYSTVETHDCRPVKKKVRSSLTNNRNSASEVLSEDVKPFNLHRCAICGQAFPTPRRLVYHRSVHQAELLAMDRCCAECGEDGFRNETALYDHINDTHNQLFKCEEPNCEKAFQLRSSLKIHGWVHGKRGLKCDVCLKQFPDSQTLKDHKITHLKVKPFQCHICFKYINRRNRLRMHLLAHESRPTMNSVMSCRHCHMAFRTIDDAKEHVFESELCRLNLDPEGRTDCSFAVPKENHPQDVEMDLERLLGEGQSSEEVNSDKKEDVEKKIEESASGDYNIEDISDFINSSVKPESDVKLEEAMEGNQTTADSTVECDLDKETDLKEAKDENDLKEEYAEEEIAMEEREEEEVVRNTESIGLAKNFKRVDELLAELPLELKVFIGAVQLTMVYRCEFCEKVFCTKDSLNDHRQYHQTKEFPYECNVCHMCFETYARVTSHKVTHGFYKITPNEVENLVEHEDGIVREKSAAQVSGYEPFPVVKYFLCQLCGHTFLHHTYYSVHYRLHHGATGEATQMCPTCNKEFPSSHLLKVHLRRSHGARKAVSAEITDSAKITKPASTNYRCVECDENFTNRVNLLKHRKTVHNESEEVETANSGLFYCNQCGKVYRTKVGLQGHQRAHKGLLFLCDLCGSAFAHQTGLDTHHKRVHMRNFTHSCEKCGLNFFSVAELQVHMHSHTGLKPYPCLHCNMSFRTKSRRSEHMRIHTGERPFPCDICGMAFRRSIAMKNHRLIHTGQRAHACHVCGKKFHIKSVLRSHMKKKHSSKYLIMKVNGDADQRAALEEYLSSLVAVTHDDSENEPEKQVKKIQVIEIPVEESSQKHRIVLSVDSGEGREKSQVVGILYQGLAAQENEDVQNVEIYNDE